MYKCEKCGLEFTKNGYYSHTKRCKLNKKDVDDIKQKYKNGYSIRDIVLEFKINKTLITKILSTDIRTLSESIKNAHLYKKDNFKHSEETKKVLRKKRLDYMKNNPEKTAWRLSNMSYPEKLFNDKLYIENYNKRYLIIREYSFFPYFIDFAFINEKIAIEIDGSQHLLEERKKKDKLKDKLLIDNGWVVIRITVKEIQKNINNVFFIINSVLNNTKTEKYINVGILDYYEIKQPYIKVKRDINGYSEREIKRSYNQRKIKNRPPLKVLLTDVKNIGYRGTGIKYGVSDNSIRKWIINYNKIK